MNVNWTYIRRSEDIQDVFRKSYVRSIYFLCPGGKFNLLMLVCNIHTVHIISSVFRKNFEVLKTKITSCQTLRYPYWFQQSKCYVTIIKTITHCEHHRFLDEIYRFCVSLISLIFDIIVIVFLSWVGTNLSQNKLFLCQTLNLSLMIKSHKSPFYQKR